MFVRKHYDYYSATISGLLATIRYIGLSKASHLMTLRLFHDYFIGKTAHIGYDYSSWNATTIADIYWLSGESPKRDAARAASGSAPPRRVPASGLHRRADPAQVETLTPQQVRRVCTANSVSALASNPQTAGVDPAGLA